ncbi:MAG: pyridoxal 5'-phosphate synthase glutaminase subunit PdxT [Acidobacteria bacterium]|nr:pyridoxal 5'-phosphate synthase glutaminase subunit PdxT [Acidobacteriota bacterium]
MSKQIDSNRRIGVLALQGDFAAHARALNRLGVEAVEIRTASALEELSGLIIPGGESTTMLKFLEAEGMTAPLIEWVKGGGALYGTCAGTILMANRVTHPVQPALRLIDITVERNAYGRQVDSFIGRADGHDLGGDPLELVFIRAPRIVEVGKEVVVLARYEGDPVLVRQGRRLSSTFHPELTQDLRIHELFLGMAARDSTSARHDSPRRVAG